MSIFQSIKKSCQYFKVLKKTVSISRGPGVNHLLVLLLLQLVGVLCEDDDVEGYVIVYIYVNQSNALLHLRIHIFICDPISFS